ncbi:tetratricopeptide (TPR) repeat protein [Chitinophaga terrae (ex Kim and Jung 2007)]|uniref:tetratricopeptide repeat protein n=1 Tax=Chitinophaga terrae (ex Kim and Jung 2007) TaxID=408074 RepID=UPI002787AF47|nr:tetratricopeptide repeat protein [Chitinophaga terrae (ex Kim and Jung 2007)]MDQ0107854.1 tetratricopeptide (TPR) repeat protein [Chitinophaga terrae (ex Kim and Jung 2007)]
MNKRKSLIVALLCAASSSVMAQSVEDGVKDLYYGKYLSAKQNLEKVIAAKPTDDKAYYYLGIAQLALEDVAGATATFQKGLQSVPNSALLQVAMGRIDLINGNAAAAKQKFEAASTATEGRNGDVARAIADANTEVKGGDRAYALSVMEKLLNNEGRKKREVYTATPADYIELGDAYRFLGGENGGKAISSYEKALDLDANNAEAVMKQGLVNYNARLKAEAVADYVKATTMDPKYGPAYFELFNFYITPKKDQLSWDEAAKYLQKYMEVADPADKTKNEYLAAYISFFKKDYDDAIAKGKAALPAANDFYANKLNLLVGDAYLQKGDSLNAQKTMDEYVAKVGESKLDSNDYKLLSNIYMRLKSSDSATQAQYSDKALDYLQKYANSITSKDAETYSQIADALKNAKKYAAAGEWYQKAIDMMIANKEQPSALDYYNVGLYTYYGAISSKPADEALLTKADSAFAKVIEIKPELGSGYYWRGMSNYAKDQQAQNGLAKPYFDKYIEISGNDPKTSKNTLVTAYTYELLYYYYKEDKENIKLYADKLAAIDPSNITVKEITENMAAREKAAKPAAKPAQNKK